MTIPAGYSLRSGFLVDEDGRHVVQGLGTVADSASATGATGVAPAALADIATIAAAATAAGEYSVTVTTKVEAAADGSRTNMTLRKGSGTGTLIADLFSLASATTVSFDQVTLAEADALWVEVGASAGAASTVYVASLQATQVG